MIMINWLQVVVNQEFFMVCPPCRPILNAINTPTYKIAKFLVPLLEPVTSNTHTVLDSFKFAEEIRKQDLKVNDFP